MESSIKWGDGFLIMYSVTDRSSFEAVSHLKRLIGHVKPTLGKAKTRSDCLVLLVLLRVVMCMYMDPPTSE